MRVLITGPIGAGKTTMCEEVIRRIGHQRSTFGFLTYPILKEGRRVGFYLLDLKTGSKKLLASETLSDGPTLGRFHFSMEGIAFGIKALKRRGDLCIVDELGRVEIQGEGFFEAVPLMRKREDLIVTARTDFVNEIVDLFKVDFLIFEITAENRGKIQKKIAAVFDSSYHKKML